MVPRVTPGSAAAQLSYRHGSPRNSLAQIMSENATFAKRTAQADFLRSNVKPTAQASDMARTPPSDTPAHRLPMVPLAQNVAWRNLSSQDSRAQSQIKYTPAATESQNMRTCSSPSGSITAREGSYIRPPGTYKIASSGAVTARNNSPGNLSRCEWRDGAFIILSLAEASCTGARALLHEAVLLNFGVSVCPAHQGIHQRTSVMLHVLLPENGILYNTSLQPAPPCSWPQGCHGYWHDAGLEPSISRILASTRPSTLPKFAVSSNIAKSRAMQAGNCGLPASPGGTLNPKAKPYVPPGTCAVAPGSVHPWYRSLVQKPGTEGV